MHTRDLSGFSLSSLTPVSFYWLGFLLADGHFRKMPSSSIELSVELSNKDLTHLQTLLLFLGRDISSYSSRTRQTKLSAGLQTHVSFRLSSNELCDLVAYFDIHHNKTKFPPNITNYLSLSLLQKQCLLIGYIDGDGFVRGRLGHRDGKLECHSSWISMYEFFNSFLITPYTISCKEEKVILFLSSVDVGNLYEMACRESLPILMRKWKSVKESLAYKKPSQTNKKTEILKQTVSKLKLDYTQKQIGEKLNITIDTVKYIYKLLGE